MLSVNSKSLSYESKGDVEEKWDGMLGYVALDVYLYSLKRCVKKGFPRSNNIVI